MVQATIKWSIGGALGYYYIKCELEFHHSITKTEI